MTVQDLQDLLNSAAGSGTIIISIVSIILSIGALFFSLRDAHSDRVNSNSWQTYRAYNSSVVRKGRALSQKVMRDTDKRGFATYTEYRAYFGELSSAATPDEMSQNRQHLHDLAAFYHQTGVLLNQGRLDKDFTLLMVGQGLADRWPVYQEFASFYADDAKDGSFPYGGIYLLYEAYRKWNASRFVRLRRKFSRSRAAALGKAGKTTTQSAGQ